MKRKQVWLRSLIVGLLVVQYRSRECAVSRNIHQTLYRNWVMKEFSLGMFK